MDNINELWTAVLNEIDGKVSTAVMNTWINTLVPVSFDDNGLTLETSTGFKKNIIVTRFLSEITRATEAVLGFDVPVSIVSAVDDEEQSGSTPSITRNTTANTYPANSSEPTFANFIVGSTNQFAYVAAVAVSNNPGSVHNPLFIYGESGLGKTHLLKAIRAEVAMKNPGLNILYTSGGTGMNRGVCCQVEKIYSRELRFPGPSWQL